LPDQRFRKYCRPITGEKEGELKVGKEGPQNSLGGLVIGCEIESFLLANLALEADPCPKGNKKGELTLSQRPEGQGR